MGVLRLSVLVPPRFHLQTRAILLLLLFCCIVPWNSANAWVYPEHREITLRAIRTLEPHDRQVLDRLWNAARTGYASRLSEGPADTTDTEQPATIDFAAWPAIAGDHSCSAAEMLQTILQSGWIMDVAAVGARLQAELASAGGERHDLTNALRRSDLRLLRVDPGYAGRASSNNVHFLLARPYTQTDEPSYVETCMANGCELNAVGAYAWYHASALQKAGRLAQDERPGDNAGSMARSALADEAFALHFLQDMFAAGHIVGTRGDASQRKGTHDYYNEAGLEVHTWDGKPIVVNGDAWMRGKDADRAAVVIRASLRQVLQAAEGKGSSTLSGSGAGTGIAPDTLNACLLESMPGRDFDRSTQSLINAIVMATPVPGLMEGDGELPRFRSELGPFVGITPAARVSTHRGGFGREQTSSGGIGGLEMGVRIGLGLAGVLSESGDGLVSLDMGFRQDAPSSISIYQSDAYRVFGHIFSAIPARPALTARLRCPFWLVPFDLILAAPVVYPTSPEMYTTMAALAGNGGLIPWQSGIATSFGRFQMVLGREVACSLYGYVTDPDQFLLPGGDIANEEVILASVRSVQLEFPFLEYRPFRSFSLDQTSSLVIQFFGAVDIPTSVSDVYPAGYPDPELRSIWSFGVRASFDWRYYW